MRRRPARLPELPVLPPRRLQRLPRAQAERVVDKKRSNFCDFFVFADDRDRRGRTAGKEDARSRLDALFKK